MRSIVRERRAALLSSPPLMMMMMAAPAMWLFFTSTSIDSSAEAWVENKMMSSWIMAKKGQHCPGASLRHERAQGFLPLIMTKETADIDEQVVPPGRYRRFISLHQKGSSSSNGRRSDDDNDDDKKKKAHILSRTVPVTADLDITVWEWEKPAAVIETYWQVEQQGLSLTMSNPTGGYNNNVGTPKKSSSSSLLDPFGLVCWPGSVVAAQEMKEHVDYFYNKRVLILGAGVGVEAQAAALIGGAAKVIATDIHPTTLRLLQYGVEQGGLSSIIKTRILDLDSVEPLPPCDVMVIADMLYNEKLAQKVIRRVLEARQSYPPVKVLISDSQRFVKDFDVILSEKLQLIGQERVQWVSRWLPSFTGSGVLIDEDQTYQVKARVIWVGEGD